MTSLPGNGTTSRLLRGPTGPLSQPGIREWELNENSTHYDRLVAAPSDHELVQFWSGWAGIMFVTAIVTTLVFVPIVTSKRVRKNPFHFYLFFLMAPDMAVAWICGSTCLSNALAGHFTSAGMCKFQSFYMIAYICANSWLNAVVARELFIMLQAASKFKRYHPPKHQRVLHQVSGVYLYSFFLASWGMFDWDWWPHKTRLTIGAACVPMDYDTASTVFFYCIFFPLLFGMPLVYICYAAYQIWKHQLLPPTGRRRVLAVYFFRIAAVFLIMWLPGLLLLFVTGAWVDPWVVWVGGSWSHLQGLVSTLVILFKPDIWRAVTRFYGHCCCCHKGRINNSTRSSSGNNNTSRVESQVTLTSSRRRSTFSMPNWSSHFLNFSLSRSSHRVPFGNDYSMSRIEHVRTEQQGEHQACPNNEEHTKTKMALRMESGTKGTAFYGCCCWSRSGPRNTNTRTEDSNEGGEESQDSGAAPCPSSPSPRPRRGGVAMIWSSNILSFGSSVSSDSLNSAASQSEHSASGISSPNVFSEATINSPQQSDLCFSIDEESGSEDDQSSIGIPPLVPYFESNAENSAQIASSMVVDPKATVEGGAQPFQEKTDSCTGAHQQSCPNEDEHSRIDLPDHRPDAQGIHSKGDDNAETTESQAEEDAGGMDEEKATESPPSSHDADVEREDVA